MHSTKYRPLKKRTKKHTKNGWQLSIPRQSIMSSSTSESESDKSSESSSCTGSSSDEAQSSSPTPSSASTSNWDDISSDGDSITGDVLDGYKSTPSSPTHSAVGSIGLGVGVGVGHGVRGRANSRHQPSMTISRLSYDLESLSMSHLHSESAAGSSPSHSRKSTLTKLEEIDEIVLDDAFEFHLDLNYYLHSLFYPFMDLQALLFSQEALYKKWKRQKAEIWNPPGIDDDDVQQTGDQVMDWNNTMHIFRIRTLLDRLLQTAGPKGDR